MLLRCSRLSGRIACRAALLILVATAAAAQAADDAALPASDVQAVLLERLESQPDDAAAWRLLGRVRLKSGDELFDAERTVGGVVTTFDY